MFFSSWIQNLIEGPVFFPHNKQKILVEKTLLRSTPVDCIYTVHPPLILCQHSVGCPAQLYKIVEGKRKSKKKEMSIGSSVYWVVLVENMARYWRCEVAFFFVFFFFVQPFAFPLKSPEIGMGFQTIIYSPCRNSCSCCTISVSTVSMRAWKPWSPMSSCWAFSFP